MEKYIVVSYDCKIWAVENAINKLKKEVCDMIDVGYIPCGGVSMNFYTKDAHDDRNFIVSQAMIYSPESA